MGALDLAQLVSKNGEETPTELGDPPQPPPRRGSELFTGAQILPVQRFAIWSPEELEMVVRHWLREKVERGYGKVVRYAGPGDKGRDVAGYDGALNSDPWDNYQCKRYSNPLTPSDIWPELGKLVYWTSQGLYTVPRCYSFVAPRGAGPKATDLLADPERIREELLGHWDQHCSGLCAADDIKEALASFQFPEFDVVLPDDIIDDLKGTPIYPVLFGGGLSAPRPADQTPPDDIAAYELPYIDCLVEAYDDHCGTGIASAEVALQEDPYADHLRASRRDFYCAESLREFSKDQLIDPDEFRRLQDEIADGVRYVVATEHPSGYDRVLAVCSQAVQVQISDHPLKADLKPPDRSGICHQLANDGRVRWTTT